MAEDETNNLQLIWLELYRFYSKVNAKYASDNKKGLHNITDWVQAREVRKIKHFCWENFYLGSVRIDLCAPWHPIDQQNALPFALYDTNLRNWNVRIELVRCKKRGENVKQATLWSVSVWNTNTTGMIDFPWIPSYS